MDMVNTKMARPRRAWLSAGGLALVLALLASACGTDLGSLGDHSTAEDINDAGVVVGATTVAGAGSRPHAFRLDPGGAMTRLAEPDGADGSGANAVNTAGAIVGRSDHLDATSGVYHFRPIVWASDGTVTDLTPLLPTFGGSYFAGAARAVNSAGVVAGQYTYSDADRVLQSRVFIWKPAVGEMTTIPVGTLDSTYLAVYDIDEAGTVVGGSRFRPVVWTPEPDGAGYRTVELSTGYGTVRSINGRGQMVGEMGHDAVFWASLTASPVTLAAPAADVDRRDLIANDLNDGGVIVGRWDRNVASGDWTHAVRWASATSPLTDLGVNAEKGTVSLANRINGRGQAVGHSVVSFNGETPVIHAVRWDPPAAPAPPAG
jgi:probable HAF family extracellular repeat protein